MDAKSRPRAYLKAHLSTKRGKPIYKILETDSAGIKRIEVVRMGIPEIWDRVGKDNSDVLFEMVKNGDQWI